MTEEASFSIAIFTSLERREGHIKLQEQKTCTLRFDWTLRFYCPSLWSSHCALEKTFDSDNKAPWCTYCRTTAHRLSFTLSFFLFVFFLVLLSSHAIVESDSPAVQSHIDGGWQLIWSVTWLFLTCLPVRINMASKRWRLPLSPHSAGWLSLPSAQQ